MSGLAGADRGGCRAGWKFFRPCAFPFIYQAFKRFRVGRDRYPQQIYKKIFECSQGAAIDSSKRTMVKKVFCKIVQSKSAANETESIATCFLSRRFRPSVPTPHPADRKAQLAAIPRCQYLPHGNLRTTML